ncbi:DUF6259 domain-containing protein [Microbacterium sp. A93]|uniref:DUF6259 domain-containing protein n=1 Tax=Microbacterium sp. A93 TaxID=3450716 RepID=UPI003F42DFCB
MDSPHYEATTAGGLTLRVDATASHAELHADRLLTSARGRLWTMSLVHDDQRDAPVHSEQQSGTVARLDDGLRLSYDSVRTADGAQLSVSLVIDITESAAGLEFRALAEAPPGIAIREIALPVVELDASTATEDETLYRAEGLGRKTSSPRTRLYSTHTEYMVDDDSGVWSPIAYPGELSMPWHGVQSDGSFLYMGRHDPEFSSVLLSAGVPPRGDEGELWLTAVTPSGRERAVAGPVLLSRLDGDWANGAALYRSWADSWYAGPHEGAEHLNGWQRIILRHQFGQINYRYADLVGLFEEGLRYGLNGILLFGWWKGGFDRGYPVYEPDDALGGVEELSSAIAEIRSRGGFISLYANGNLIDRTSAFAAHHGAAVAKKNADGLDYVVGYEFARESQTLRHFSPGYFTIACHGAPAWRAQMEDVARTQASLGADAIFFDQTAYHLAAWPCYDASHEHGERTGIESQSRARTLRALRAAAGARSLGSEGMADCMIAELDYHHGWGFAFQYTDEAFPAMFRTAFPEPIVSNRLIQDEREGWEDQLNYAFVHNLIFDVAIHRARKDIESYPRYAALVGELSALRAQHRRYFDSGRFVLVRDADLLIARYVAPDGALEVLWNRADHDAAFEGLSVSAHSVIVRERGDIDG